MTLILKPQGSGNWATTSMTIEGPVGLLASVQVGQRIVIGGITWRVCSVSYGQPLTTK